MKTQRYRNDKVVMSLALSAAFARMRLDRAVGRGPAWDPWALSRDLSDTDTPATGDRPQQTNHRAPRPQRYASTAATRGSDSTQRTGPARRGRKKQCKVSVLVKVCRIAVKTTVLYNIFLILRKLNQLITYGLTRDLSREQS